MTTEILPALSQNTTDDDATYKALFDKQAEQHSIADLTKWLKHFSSQVWILDHVIQLRQVVAQNTCDSDDDR